MFSKDDKEKAINELGIMALRFYVDYYLTLLYDALQHQDADAIKEHTNTLKGLRGRLVKLGYYK